MNTTNSKKLNSRQRLIAMISIVVVVLLAICVTFAWFTNRINIMKGTFTLGSFNYRVELFDISSGGTMTSKGAQTYTNANEDDETFAEATFNPGSIANNSVHYQVVKVTNNADFDIKAYEYLSFGELNDTQKALANYFYFKPFKIESVSGKSYFQNLPAEINDSTLSTYFASNMSDLPNADAVAAIETDWTFGNLDNNAVALETGSVGKQSTQYYLLAYCLRGLTDEQLRTGGSFMVTPVIAIGQANGPVPQTSGAAKITYADSWQALKSAIDAAENGDTIYMTGNVEGPANTNLSIDNGINLHLNGYNLKIHGDLIFNYNVEENRTVTVPAASRLYVDGDLHISSIGTFTLTGSGSSQNVLLGKRVQRTVNNELQYVVTGGNFYVNCGLTVDEKTKTGASESAAANLTALQDDEVNEDSGFILNNVVPKKINTSNSYEDATLTVSGANTMVKLASGAQIGTITVKNAMEINDVYIVNYGIIGKLNLANVVFPVGRNLVCGLYVKNYNAVNPTGAAQNNVSLPAAATGYKSGSATTYNTRLIDAEGALTGFTSLVPGNGESASFRAQDVEPFLAGSTEQSEVYSLGGGVYEVYLRDTSKSAELITGLFADSRYNFDPLNCRELRIITTNTIKLKEAQFTDIRDNFKNLNILDLSRTALYNTEIPAGALNVADSEAANKIEHFNGIVLPVTQLTIGANAFKGTEIEQITIGSNVVSMGANAFATDGHLEVIWDNSDDDKLQEFIEVSEVGAFDVENTTIFMDPSLVQKALNGNVYTDAWKMNMYEFYDFKADSGRYYCKYARDGSEQANCSIVYYAGTLAEKVSGGQAAIIPATLSDGTTSYQVTSIGTQAFRKAINNDGGVTNLVIDLSGVHTVSDSAFSGSAVIDELSLASVTSIGSKAFKGNNITVCDARPSSFAGMTHLGAFAFQGATIHGGILDLHGPSERYSPDDYALAGLTFTGSSGVSDNAKLILTHINTIPAHFGNNMNCQADIILNDINKIAGGAFARAIRPNAEAPATPTNVVDARDVTTIGEKAFFNIQCGVLYLGTYSDDYISTNNETYKSIIGQTIGEHIGKLVLDGNLSVSSNQPALASTDSGENTTIKVLEIACHLDEENHVVQTTIPQWTFATNATGPAAGNNLEINALTIGTKTYETTETVEGVQEQVTHTEYASFNIGDYAFRGVNFAPADSSYIFDFEGVVNVYEGAFAESRIRNLSLGTKIEYIEHENFIEHCDYIRSLKLMNAEQMVVLAGNTDANAKFSSNGRELENFTIEVDYSLEAYIAAERDGATNAWHGWRDYFAALIHKYVCGVQGDTSSAYISRTRLDGVRAWRDHNPQIMEWSFIIVDNKDSSKRGAKLIGVKLVDDYQDLVVNEMTGSDSCYDPIMWDLDENNRPVGLPKVLLKIGTATSADLHRILRVPAIVTVGSTTYEVTEIGDGEDVFAELEGDYTYDPANSIDKRFELSFDAGVNGTSAACTKIRVVDAMSLKSDCFKLADTATLTNGTTYHLYVKDEIIYQIMGTRSYTTGSTWGNLEIAAVGVTKDDGVAYSDTFNANTADEYTLTGKSITIGSNVTKIQKWAFTGCENFDKIVVPNNLEFIDTGAFEESSVKTFDLLAKTSLLRIGENAFGKPRKKTLDDNGYYMYTQITDIRIYIHPNQQATFDRSDYYMYSQSGCLIAISPSAITSVVSPGASAQEIKPETKLGTKNAKQTVIINGVSYYMMSSGAEYNEKKYSSASSQFIAVVDGLDENAAALSTLIIPSSITVRGVSYEVVGITDTAFGTNDVLETLVLPSKAVSYSSDAFAGCSKLGIIQYNDIMPYIENMQNNVAELPTPSAQSLIEGKNDEESAD